MSARAACSGLSRNPAAKTADELSEGLAEGEISAADGEHFYRLLGAYRGVSEAPTPSTGGVGVMQGSDVV